MYNIHPCNGEDQEMIIAGLVEYNLQQVTPKQEELFIDLSKKITDEHDNIIAGIIARMYCWNCVYIDTLWVSASYRGTGLGTQLLQEVEQEARNKGAYLIHLDTFDFQAKDFYQRHGYEIFGELENCPEGHSRYFLKKCLLEL